MENIPDTDPVYDDRGKIIGSKWSPERAIKNALDRGLARDRDLDKRLAEIDARWQKLDAVQRERTMEKAREYDGLDLEIMGTAMQGLLPPGLDAETRHQAGLEMAVAFYQLGKIARMFASYRRGTLPGPDSNGDLRVYATMGMIIRETGKWT